MGLLRDTLPHLLYFYLIVTHWYNRHITGYGYDQNNKPTIPGWMSEKTSISSLTTDIKPWLERVVLKNLGTSVSARDSGTEMTFLSITLFSYLDFSIAQYAYEIFKTAYMFPLSHIRDLGFYPLVDILYHTIKPGGYMYGIGVIYYLRF